MKTLENAGVRLLYWQNAFLKMPGQSAKALKGSVSE